MGFPVIQIFMIAARQVSKPIADAAISYGKGHPKFRNKVLIPVGKALYRLTQRIRMKRLNLGDNISNAPIAEKEALEHASDFVQQLVLFSYSVSVFAGFYFYQKNTNPENVQLEEFTAYRKETEKVIAELKERLEELEKNNKSVVTKRPPPPSAPAVEQTTVAVPKSTFSSVADIAHQLVRDVLRLLP